MATDKSDIREIILLTCLYVTHRATTSIFTNSSNFHFIALTITKEWTAKILAFYDEWSEREKSIYTPSIHYRGLNNQS